MKIQELKKLIREEVRKVLKEAATIDSTLLNKLKIAMTARMRDPEDENAHDEVKDLLTQIYQKMGAEDAEGLAAGNMEDEVTMTGPVSAVVSLIKDTIKVLNEENAPKDSIFNDKIDTALGKISGYDGMQFNKEKNIVTVTFTDTASRAKGMNLLNKLFPDFKYTTDDVDIIDDEGMLAKIYDLDITK